MKKSGLISATGAAYVAAGLVAATPAAALVDSAAINPPAITSVVGEGSIEQLHEFLVKNPDSPLAGEVFGKIVQQIAETEICERPRIDEMFRRYCEALVPPVTTGTIGQPPAVTGSTDDSSFNPGGPGIYQ